MAVFLPFAIIIGKHELDSCSHCVYPEEHDMELFMCEYGVAFTHVFNTKGSLCLLQFDSKLLRIILQDKLSNICNHGEVEQNKCLDLSVIRNIWVFVNFTC